MDTVEEVFYSVLSGATPVTAIVSTRIYPAILPEDVNYPSIVFARTGSEGLACIGIDLQVGKATINVVALSTSIATAGMIGRAVRDAVMGINGTYGSLAIKQVDLESGPRSDYDSTLEVHLSVLDFSVLYEDL